MGKKFGKKTPGNGRDWRESWESLPITSRKGELIKSVRKHATTVIVGETGSGKSTQLPKYLAEAFYDSKGSVICTQPRRVAAVTVAQRVAAELGVDVGAEVGYNIRFEDKTSSKTKIKFVTDGVLLRECMVNSDLDGYDVIILDEAHERSLSTDILMGIIKDIQARKPSLRLVVMSATLQVDLFMDFFADTNLIMIEGRQHPVTVMYTKEAEEDYVDAALCTCAQIHASEAPGGVLVFLPGQEDIENLQALLEAHLPSVIGRTDASAAVSRQQHLQKRLAAVREDIQMENNAAKGTGDLTKALLYDFEIRPLYASMPPDQQLAAFDAPDPGVRKFILSTNVAETSVTISGIRYVVDCGFFKCRLMETATGMEMLKVTPVSQAQANQRAGRAGREAPGKCFRVFPEPAFEELRKSSVPEIQRVSVTQVMLQLLDIGIKDPKTFPYPSPPSESSIRKAGRDLLHLGAVDASGKMTAMGKKMASLPLEPVYAALLLLSAEEKYGCIKEMLTVVSMLSTDNVLLMPHREADKQAASRAHKALASAEGDIPTLLNIFIAWGYSRKSMEWASQHYLSQRALLTAANIREQLCSLLSKLHHIDVSVSCWPDEKSNYLKCLTAGLCLQVAQKNNTKMTYGGNGSSGSSSTGNNDVNQRHIAKTNAARSFAENIGLQGAAKTAASVAPYVTLNGRQPVYVHPTSVLFGRAGNFKNLPEFVVYSELLITTKQYMRGLTAIDGEWLEDLPGSASALFKSSNPSKGAKSDTNSGAMNGGDSIKGKMKNKNKNSDNPAFLNQGAKRGAASLGNYQPVSKTKKKMQKTMKTEKTTKAKW